MPNRDDGIPYDMHGLRVWMLRQWIKAALIGLTVGAVIGTAILIGAVVSIAF